MRIPERNLYQQILYMAGLYRHYLRIYFRVLCEYAMDTWIAITSGMLVLASSLLFLGVTMQRVPRLMGWSFEQLLFIFSIAATGRGLAQVFLNAPFSFHGYLRRGGLDILMVRPAGIMFQMIGLSQEFAGAGTVLTGLAMIALVAPKIQVVWSFGPMTYLVLALVCSTLIQFAVMMLVVIPGFWVIEMRSVIYPVSWLIDFSRYPLEIFHPAVRILLTYIFPYAMGSFFPAAYLIHPQQYGWALYAVPGVTLLLLMLVYQFWRFGLNHYSSAT